MPPISQPAGDDSADGPAAEQPAESPAAEATAPADSPPAEAAVSPSGEAERLAIAPASEQEGVAQPEATPTRCVALASPGSEDPGRTSRKRSANVMEPEDPRGQRQGSPSGAQEPAGSSAAASPLPPDEVDYRAAVLAVKHEKRRGRIPRPTDPKVSGTQCGSPPPYKPPSGDDVQGPYCDFLKKTFVPGTSIRRDFAAGRQPPRPNSSGSGDSVSKRLYPEQTYASAKERKKALAQQRQELQHSLRRREVQLAPLLSKEQLSKMADRLHAEGAKRRARTELTLHRLIRGDLPGDRQKPNPARLDKDAVESLRHRLHDRWLERRKSQERELRTEAESPKPALTPPPRPKQLRKDRTGRGDGPLKLSDIVEHNYAAAVQQQKDSAERLRIKYGEPANKADKVWAPPPIAAANGTAAQGSASAAVRRKLNKQEQAESGNRLCSNELARRKEKHAKLLNQYLTK
eukprot:TRINITY_DN6848_c0_g1_i1.p1 TRINITY_DN6848_c0_g1~~TRINITY_DN6848_c0_g1_i1.p1  ORF type:complete len:485 (+),score=107.38 TRINITY_DN6848_c0_g1_i1:75-1457(+)